MSDYLDPNNEELLKDFFAEADAQVQVLEQNILVLENDPSNKDAVDEIFRAAHTLKGGSATVAMNELALFTHVVEDLLDAIRSDKVKVSEAIIDALLRGIDIIKEMLESRKEGKVYTKNIDADKNLLASFIETKPSQPKAQPAKSPESSVQKPVQKQKAASSVSLEGITEYEILEIREAAGPDRVVYAVEITFDENNVMNTVSAIHAFAALRDVGTILKTIPDFEKLYEDTFHPVVTYFVASSKALDDVKAKATIPDVTKELVIYSLTQEGSFTVEFTTKETSARVSQEPEKVSQIAAEAFSKQESSSAAMSAAPATGTMSTSSVSAQKAAMAQSETPAPQAQTEEEIQAVLAEENASTETKKTAQQAGSVLRVDSRRIDNLLNLVSEAVINKATFNQISNQFGELQNRFSSVQLKFREMLKNMFDSLPDYFQRIQSGEQIKDIKKELSEKYLPLFSMFDTLESDFKNNIAKFRSTAQNLGRITGDLQEGVMRIRMVPISQIFSRFPRLIRDLSKSLNKKINLVIEGEDTELDKSVIEDLLDPLMHSVRNSLDHGIESPEERLRAGKPEQGIVMLKASNEGNMIIIEIADDGAGIDLEKVRKRAVERGLIHPNKILTELEAYNLIFEPGFSTADKITNISGRGVGLDVVKRQIEKLNGTVTVTSQRGKGTRFIIKLPLTLAIIQGLLVKVGKEIYSIPITSVIESHRIKPSDIKFIDNYEVFNVRNDVVSLLRLNRLFRIPTNEQSEYCFVVIVGTNEKRVGLMVDSLIGEEDVVIKPLRDSFTNSPGIAGASILGDGSVCLIIDVSQLLELGQKKELEERQRMEMTIR